MAAFIAVTLEPAARPRGRKRKKIPGGVRFEGAATVCDVNETGRPAPDPIAVELETEERDGVRRERLSLGDQARGPWSEDAVHGGAPAALLARTAEAWGSRQDLRLAGLSLFFYGPVPLGEIVLESKLLKPGRRQQLLGMEISRDGRTLLDARAVLMRRGRLELDRDSLDNGITDPMTAPGEGRRVGTERWAPGDTPAFHRTANTVMAVDGGPDRARARGAAWFRLEAPVVGGEPASGAQRAVAAADFGNGVAHAVPFGSYLFANPDLNVSLARDPVGEWIGVRARTGFDPAGAGATSTDLFDADGWIGVASQTLYLEKL